ncbi:hypothetical protein MSG28_003758 [Choristoneura fumiferana]|uniref:Uncharacterized protein n=1 Tax=Choristoneura fumiferana TaxID=7141 RepID=A0ACC0KGS5_CHOFU|nr:hypothetical protein MSG28_003758 [Choristoneura fumiferana]
MRTRLNFSMCHVVVKIMDRGARSKFILGLVNKNYGIGKISLPNLVRNTSKDQEGKPIKWLKIKCLRWGEGNACSQAPDWSCDGFQSCQISPEAPSNNMPFSPFCTISHPTVFAQKDFQDAHFQETELTNSRAPPKQMEQ